MADIDADDAGDAGNVVQAGGWKIGKGWKADKTCMQIWMEHVWKINEQFVEN